MKLFYNNAVDFVILLLFITGCLNPPNVVYDLPDDDGYNTSESLPKYIVLPKEIIIIYDGERYNLSLPEVLNKGIILKQDYKDLVCTPLPTTIINNSVLEGTDLFVCVEKDMLVDPTSTLSTIEIEAVW